MKNAKKVLLIGWDAADWKFLTPLMDKGLMPNLSKLVDEGVKGRLATLDPPLSPTLWTSIATGKRPYKHGIHGFTEPDPSGNGIRPINNTNRKVKAIWNILTQQGYKSNVVGWWPSHPAEHINGVMVSNFYQRANAPLGDEWPMIKGTVSPESFSEKLASLRVHPGELTEAHVLPFVPNAAKIDQVRDRKLQSIQKVTADCSSIQCAATYLLDKTEWDFSAIYFDAIDHYCHGFMKYHPPHREHIALEEYEMYKDVVNGACQFHDMMLGTLLDLAGEDTTVMLISDHGFHPDHNRPIKLPKEPSGPALEHSPYGIIVMKGPNIKKDELLFGASLLDITPTLLTLFGLPVAEDMDGKVLIQAFENEPEIHTIKSWEQPKDGEELHKNEIVQSKEEMDAELQQLIDLGYIADPGDDIEGAIKRTVDENNYYLARSYIDGNEWNSGIEILKSLFEGNPSTLRYGIRLSHAYQNIGNFRLSRKIIDQIRNEVNIESVQLDLLEGTQLLVEEKYKKALDIFIKSEKESGESASINLRIAQAYFELNKFDQAVTLVLKVLAFDAENEKAYYLLGLCYLHMMRYQESANALLDSIGLMYYNPASHFYLGEALFKLEKYEDAVEAYDTCLRFSANINQARERIITIYTRYLNQPGKALKYRTDFESKIKGEITIVSGLPRSGTSMMMQMLEAGGLEIFTDKQRSADENNPKGYYEHEAVMNLAKNKKWLPKANNKVVKVIAHLLHHLPMDYRYKIIFMERDVIEVVQSQQRMLVRNGKKVKEEVLPLRLVDKYNKTLENVKLWAEKQPNVEIHLVSYRSAIESPFLEAINVNDFMDGKLMPEKMAATVDASLYREKIN